MCNILAWRLGKIPSTTQKKKQAFYIKNDDITWDFPSLQVTQLLFREFFIEIQARANGDGLVTKANDL